MDILVAFLMQLLEFRKSLNFGSNLKKNNAKKTTKKLFLCIQKYFKKLK